MCTDIPKIALAALIACVALVCTAGQKIDLENLAKGEQNISRIEENNGKHYTAYNVKDIKALLGPLSTGEDEGACGASHSTVLWLGNSQLHYINQYQIGDHLAPYWLRTMTDSDCIRPLGCSLPNAGFQEYLILSRYAAIRVPIQLLIMELVFDDLREAALRYDFAEILSSNVAAEMRRTSCMADEIVGRFLLSNKDVGDAGKKEVLSGTIQEPIEKWLNASLSIAWNLWASRPQIEGNMRLGLYNLRNYLLGIKPTTVRKMIRARYDLNMGALRDIIKDYQQRKIPVLLYIAPIRQDKPIPYDGNEYARWKKELSEVAQHFGAYLVNLEKLVPDEMWGSYTADDVDFMHFQGPGHRLVAEALLPHVQEILETRGN